ncbi:MAG: hypothetical protein Fur005_18850 [Roseiflexaceae bacterium]
MGVIALGCVGIGGLAFYENWQQEQNYQAGHAAYLNADCATASDPLAKAASGNPGTKDSEVARKAEAELQECQAFTEIASLPAGDAVLNYRDFVSKYDPSPLSKPALENAQGLIANTQPADLAGPGFCQSLDDLVADQYIAQPDAFVPAMLLVCGQAAETEQAFSDAVFYYDRFRSEFPDHPQIEDANESFVRATIAEAEAFGAGGLPAPQVIGGGSDSGEVVVIIQNDSPEKLSMVFSGPETRVEELGPCTDCEKFTGDGPAACPELGPVGRYVLAPGTYTVVVKASSDQGVTPFSGSWELEGGQEYSSCFFLVTSN